jgi:hypothetical protein
MPLPFKFTAWEGQHISDYIGCLLKLHYENKQKSCYGLLEDPAVIKTNTRSSKQRVRQVAAKAAWPCTA